MSFEVKNFYKEFPYPNKLDIKRLYKFYSIRKDNIPYLRELFVRAKLYCAEPSTFNDPFECKPHFKWPDTPKHASDLRKHLVKVGIQLGLKRKQAKALISKNIRSYKDFEAIINQSSQKAFNDIRISCFTETYENLLMWSHYADSHMGFCLEFDVTSLPLSMAYKVKYQDDYPSLLYPMPCDERALIPVLVKSEDWRYEDEFRVLLNDKTEIQPRNDGKSFYLNGNEIKNVYIGCRMKEDMQKELLSMIGEGPFQPKLWQVKPSQSKFNLEIKEV